MQSCDYLAWRSDRIEFMNGQKLASAHQSFYTTLIAENRHVRSLGMQWQERVVKVVRYAQNN